jgi:hypothetical protein
MVKCRWRMDTSRLKALKVQLSQLSHRSSFSSSLLYLLYPDDLESVCQTLLCPMSPSVNYHYSSGSHVRRMCQIGHDQIAETQSISLRVEVTGTNLQILYHARESNWLNHLPVPVLGVQNLPRLKTFGRNTRFYATVTNGARTWRTRFMQSVGNRVEWNESVDTWVLSYFYVYLRLSLLQFCITTLSCHDIPLCEKDYT